MNLRKYYYIFLGISIIFLAIDICFNVVEKPYKHLLFFVNLMFIMFFTVKLKLWEKGIYSTDFKIINKLLLVIFGIGALVNTKKRK